MTIARVASPPGVDRAYQTLFLRSLKSFFGSSRRLVKNGDIIAVSLDTDAVNRCGADTESGDFDEKGYMWVAVLRSPSTCAHNNWLEG